HDHGPVEPFAHQIPDPLSQRVQEDQGRDPGEGEQKRADVDPDEISGEHSHANRPPDGRWRCRGVVPAGSPYTRRGPAVRPLASPVLGRLFTISLAAAIPALAGATGRPGPAADVEAPDTILRRDL